MKDIVITANTAVGSVLALAEAIITKIGCKAYVFCTDRKTSKVLASSRFIYDVIYIDAENEQEYIAKIQSWYKTIKFEEKPILYFTTDTTCFYINDYRSWFESNFDLCLPSSEIIQTFTQKGIAEIKAEKSGLVVPKTRVLRDKNDIEAVLSDFNFPVILKPRATYLNEGLDFKIKVIKDRNEFLLFSVGQLERSKNLLCQEFISGGNDTSYYYLFYRTKNGNIFENTGRKTLQSTPDGGIMLKGMSEANKELSAICKGFLKNIDYQGIGGIEFKKYNNQFYFIEMSVRLEGFFKISEIASTPLSLISYYDIAKDAIPSNLTNTSQQNGCIYIDSIPTFINYTKNKELISPFIDLSNIIFNYKVKLNVFSIRDYKPFFIQFFNLLKRKI